MPTHDTDLLTRIPLSARTILHVGLGDSDIAAAYRPMNPTARLLGLSYGDAIDADTARDFDQVATADGSGAALPFDVPHGIDCIIYDQVLEHLEDPWTLVRQHAEALAPNGVILIHGRNNAHWRLADGLLRGGPVPASLPGLDVTAVPPHLEDAGLFPLEPAVQEAAHDEANRFVAAMAPSLIALGINPDHYRQRCIGSHVIWRACKAPAQRLFISGSMLDPVGGVSHVRVVHPLRAMNSDPFVRGAVTDRIGRPADGDPPHIFVLHRPALFGERGKRILTALSEAGYMIVTEFDDHPDHFDMMRAGGELTFTGVHALQTSTEPLAEELRKYNPEVAVFPNALLSLPAVKNFASPESMTFFFGALNREKDWEPYMPVINEVASLAGERLKFQVVHDGQFFAALDTPHKTFTPTCNYDTYQDLLAGSEISFMPLADTPFNRAKSDLKFIEAGSHRVAALASAIVYENSIADGKNGLIFRDPVQLRLALLRLVALPGLARRLAEEARAYVRAERMMAYQVSTRIAWYRSLLERRDVLEQARRMRLARYAGLAA